jgi:hypothetical protein
MMAYKQNQPQSVSGKNEGPVVLSQTFSGGVSVNENSREYNLIHTSNECESATPLESDEMFTCSSEGISNPIR